VIRNTKIGGITMPKGKEKKPNFVNIAPLKGTSPEYCPKCNSKRIHERRTKTKPKYKCGDCGHEFPNP
jgi:DNA-directed RNA polymerase subunit RPC12/RpoP